ncbi:hypothetical protein [Tropicimonas sp. IMCC6043]|uniref:hypothetical protein n=1 Tax=Tropicimonas sp. IMCC6043 TaxID=2510645 RepID=UPI00101D9E21|nr:hypothetical protein [Tropicimonas sp. IMCC6043]RYH10100.1 hypothetical protein EU800_09435 [Tropicimonas sp. IMCC6043]
MTRQFTLVKDEAFTALSTRLPDDLPTLLASTESFATGDRIRTLAEGFGYEVVDNGEDLTTAGGARLTVLPDSTGTFPVDAFGTGTAALTHAMARPSVTLSGAVPVVAPVVATDILAKLTGAGWHRYSDEQAKAPAGALVEATDGSVVDLLTIRSTDPGSGVATAFQGLALSDFGLIHRGAGTGLTIDNATRTEIRNVLVDCMDSGATGIRLANGSFFARIEGVVVLAFQDTGLLIEGIGSQHVLRDCHVASGDSAANATVGVELRGIFDFHIDGGQYNVHRGDGTGIGILVNNTTAAGIEGGLIENCLTEDDTAVKITGDTYPMAGITIRNHRVILSRSATAFIFDRASQCRLIEPRVDHPTAGGVLAQFTANAAYCTIEGNLSAMQAPLDIDPAAVGIVKRCTQPLSYIQRDLITTDPNLTVICDHVEFVGRCVHNGTAWNTSWVYLLDDTAATFDLPNAGGIVEIIPRSEARYRHGALSYSTSGSAPRADVGSQFERRDAVLTGITGTDGKISAGISGGKLHVENRSGTADSFIIRFHGRDVF